MLQTKGWAVSHGPGLRVEQHSRALIPHGVQPFVVSSQLQQLGECSLCPSSSRAPALPLSPGGHSCSMSGEGWRENPKNAQARQERKPTSPAEIAPPGW